MTLTIGEKKHRTEVSRLGEDKIKVKIRKECLINAYCFMKEGKTRQSDEAVRVYKRLEKEKEK